MIGVIRTLFVDKGFGFIEPETGPRLFFHASFVQGPFDQRLLNRRVECDSVPSEKGPRASFVRPLADGETI